MSLCVVDASAVVALLLDGGPAGRWVRDEIAGAALAAPSVLPFECANVLRRLERAGLTTSDQAAQAHADLLSLPIEYWPYEPLAQRAWELRHNLTAYDASYVAVAEISGGRLITLDSAFATTPGLRCHVDTA